MTGGGYFECTLKSSALKGDYWYGWSEVRPEALMPVARFTTNKWQMSQKLAMPSKELQAEIDKWVITPCVRAQVNNVEGLVENMGEDEAIAFFKRLAKKDIELLSMTINKDINRGVAYRGGYFRQMRESCQATQWKLDEVSAGIL